MFSHLLLAFFALFSLVSVASFPLPRDDPCYSPTFNATAPLSSAPYTSLSSPATTTDVRSNPTFVPPSSSSPTSSAPVPSTSPTSSAPVPSTSPTSSAPVSSTSVTVPAPAPATSATSSTPSASPTTASDTTGGPFTGGFATYFYQNGNAGACGKVNPDSAFICALDQARYNSGLCGQQVQITNTNNGKTVTVTVADDCPTCTNSNSIDLSVAAFQAIADLSQGIVPIEWSYVG